MSETVANMVNFSMGICSAYIACTWKDEGRDPICLFSDTKREDIDTYRFGWEVARRWDLSVVEASDGRDLWDVWREQKMIPARQIAQCSIAMKIKPSQKWFESFKGQGLVAYGYDRNEEDRAERTLANWRFPNLTPVFPLIDKGIEKAQCFGYFGAHSVEVPRVYRHFQHANCLPCKNFREPDWRALYYYYPDEFEKAACFEDETGLLWMQDGPTLRELEAMIIQEAAGAPSRKGRRKLAMAEPAFDFTMGCDRCAAD